MAIEEESEESGESEESEEEVGSWFLDVRGRRGEARPEASV